MTKCQDGFATVQHVLLDRVLSQFKKCEMTIQYINTIQSIDVVILKSRCIYREQFGQASVGIKKFLKPV